MSNFEIWSEVTTEPTDWDGQRHDAWSGWDKNTAPEGYVINDKTVSVVWHADTGSENTYQITYDDWVEILPGTGLKFPRTINVRCYARSGKGPRGGRGWSKIQVIGDYVKIA